jgi:hypothetical protein
VTAGVLPGQPPSPEERRQRAAELYEQGLTLRQVGERLGVNKSTVHADLVRAGVPLRHLRLVPDPAPARATRFIPPDGSAVAFTAERGWHMTSAPPGWFLDLLADIADAKQSFGS